jgi:hypothetical protein
MLRHFARICSSSHVGGASTTVGWRSSASGSTVRGSRLAGADDLHVERPMEDHAQPLAA